MSNRNSYYDIEQLVQEARLQRSAALGQLIVRAVDSLGRALKRAFVFDKSEARSPQQNAKSLKLRALGNER